MKAGERLFTGRTVSETDAKKYNEMVDRLNRAEATDHAIPSEIDRLKNEIHQYFISLCYKEISI